jgi:glutamine synthetase
MGQINSRFQALQTVIARKPKETEFPKNAKGIALKVSEFYGVYTFSQKKMQERLQSPAFKRFVQITNQGQKLDQELANNIAHAVKEWALEYGVTHFCHWFQPQTGTTAEKHDAFLTVDSSGQAIERFSGSQLIQSEPDASSFPSGGMRTTFEARGYTAWDPTSPMFILDTGATKTLCIPSVFISYHGDALDEKTGLLRSNEVLSSKACALLKLIGDQDVEQVTTTLGPEQEYFLIDRALYALRPDLIMAGRSLLGARPPKGQQLEDHYFGSIPPRVLAFMADAEAELFKLGVPTKTRHNEVAPNQFESAPIFEEANVAVDHNQLTMEVTRRIARKHDFEALFHEKPFAGVNGSGKHNNWSMMVARGGNETSGLNLLDPGKTPQDNLRFLLFLVATLKGVHKHAGLLRAAIASSGNDHRLGANEAPPAIISVFLGKMLDDVLNQIEANTHKKANYEEAIIALGVSRLPQVAKDNTDRNRTSPFAFTGNKFEFRAVGSSANCAFPVTLVNAAVADGLSAITTALESKLKAGVTREDAIFQVLKDVIQETKAIRFEGNNYSDEWVVEAKKRGLLNLKKTPEALGELVTAKSIQMLTSLGIFSEAEIQSRYHVRLENYVKRVLIEAECLQALVETCVLPASYEYLNVLTSGVSSAKAAGVVAPQVEVANRISKLSSETNESLKRLVSALDSIKALDSEEERAKQVSVGLASLLEEVRTSCDQLECLVADRFWPLPKYREMLLVV